MAAPEAPKIELPPAPPLPPRRITPAVLRRSIVEPRVRFWWAAGGALLIVALYFLLTRTLDWFQDLNVVRNGAPVTAVVVRVGEGEVEGVSNLSPDYPVTLQFDYNGKQYSVGPGYLEGRREPISPKQSVNIKVDPANPEHWTYLTEAPSILHAILSAILVAPFAAAAIVASFFSRRRVLRIWTNGVAHPFVVIKTGQSALAPASRTVHCRAADGRDQRLICVFIPRRLTTPKPGQILWLIHPPGKPTAAIPAITYC